MPWERPLPTIRGGLQATNGKPAGGYFVHRWVAQANTFYPHSLCGDFPPSLANSEYNFDINNLYRHETESARSLLNCLRETDRKVMKDDLL
jgi:hypothetical protein